jgi:hypothetical protein
MSFFNTLWDFNKRVDPVTPRIIEALVKQDSKGVRETARVLGLTDLQREADKNVNDPVRGIGRAALTAGAIFGAPYLAGAGAGAEATPEVAGAASTAPEVAGSGAGAYMAAGTTPAAGAGYTGADITGSSGSPIWSKFLNMASKQQSSQANADKQQQLMQQMRMSELMRQNAQYSDTYQSEANRGGSTYP